MVRCLFRGSLASSTRWIQSTKVRLQQNAVAASVHTHARNAGWTDFVDWAGVEIDKYRLLNPECHVGTTAFYVGYVKWMHQLALLWPAKTSEIDVWGAHEDQGWQLPDRSFALSFDDGPSNDATTREIARLLRERSLTATFFVLGAQIQMQGQLDMRSMYEGMCIGFHGHEHIKLADINDWQGMLGVGLQRIEQLATATGAVQLKSFRPTYGQRSEEQSRWVAKRGVEIRLWNIDSMDWFLRDGLLVAARVDRLMHLWRRGIILMHDRYPSTIDAIRRLLGNEYQLSSLIIDCSRR